MKRKTTLKLTPVQLPAPVEPIPAAPDRSLLPLVGSIQIGRPSGDSCDYMTIEVVDASSHAQFIEVRVKYADLMLALTGQAGTPVTFAVRGLHLIGTVAEHKTENVAFDRWSFLGRDNTAALDAVLAPYEVDGWKGSRSDLTNGHRRQPDGTQEVTFRRHVDPVTGKPVIRP